MVKAIPQGYGKCKSDNDRHQSNYPRSGRSMVDLLALNDAELQAIMLKGDGHRGRDSDRYAFMQERIEDYARDMMRKHMTYDVLYEEYLKSTDNPYGYTQFKAIIQEYERNHDYKYHNVYEPGREMQFEIRKTDRYEPTLNEAASQWCLHNGTELDECRPARPRDKGPAESLVNQTYRYYYSRICRDTFFSYDELNGRLDELNDMFNDRPRKNRAYSRREQYEREERPYMLPLPPKPTSVYAPIAAKALPPEVHKGNNHQLHLSLPGGQEPLLQCSISAYRQESQGHIRCGDG